MAGSIEDLIGKKKPPSAGSGDESPQEKFSAKMEEIRLKNLEQLAMKKARALGVDYVDLAAFPISPEAISLIPRLQSREEKVICFLFTGKEVRIAAVDPADPKVQEILFQVKERSHAENAAVY